MSKKISTQEWRALLKMLRTNFPVSRQIVVRRVKQQDCETVLFDGKCYRIYVNSILDRQSQIDSLIHGFVHVLCIDEAYDHKGRWGQVYSEVYSKWLQDQDT